MLDSINKFKRLIMLGGYYYLRYEGRKKMETGENLCVKPYRSYV